MSDLSLFLGLRKDSLFEKQSKKINPYLAALLTSGGDYLQEIILEGQAFIGKKTPISLNIEDLKLLEAHVLSLLRKLTADYPFSSNPLVLLTIVHE